MRSIPLLLLLLVGCTSARDRAVERATAAGERGDLVAAAHAWAEACGLAPEDCPRAEQAREAAIAEAVQVATPPCSAGDTARCAQALRAARTLAPADARLLAIVEDAGRRQLATCGDAQDLAGLRCAERWRGALAAAGYDAALAERRARLAAAIAAQVSGDAGADVLRLGAAACLDGTAERRAAAVAAARAWDEHLAVPLTLAWNVKGALPQLRCADLAGGRPVRCGAGGLLVEVAGEVERAQHERLASSEPVEWIAGTERVPNPAYGVAVARVLAAEDALRAVEADVAIAGTDCEAAERALNDAARCIDCKPRRFRDLACDRESQLERIASDRESALRSARWDLDRTPEFFEEPIRRTAYVEQVDHTWSAPWGATVRLGQEQRTVSGVAVHRDREHAGLQAAALAADPLEPPPGDLGTAHLAAAVRAAASQLIDEALLARASERAQACPAAGGQDDASLRCRAEVLRLSGRAADGAELLAALAGGPITCR